MSGADTVPVVEGRAIVQDYHVPGSFFARSSSVRALKGIDFRVEKGKTLAIVGESGSGKSTLARIIQYPRGPGSQRGILRHFRNHHHHFHVRYFCSSRDKQCRDNGETPRLVSVDVSRRPDHHRRHRRRAN